MTRSPIHDTIDAHAQLGDEHPFTLTPEELLRHMDEHGIATAVARPVGAELVVDHRKGNERVTSAGPRIKGLATANPWLGVRAVEELKRARDLGAVGIYLHPTRQGFMPTEPVAVPVLEFAAAHRLPVMFHTGTYIYSDVLAVGEVARRYPDLPFVMGCAGFTDMWFELPGVFAEVPNLWIETSLIWSAAIAQIVDTHGPSRVMFAGGLPRNRYAVVINALERLHWTDAIKRAIYHDNAAKLYGLA